MSRPTRPTWGLARVTSFHQRAVRGGVGGSVGTGAYRSGQSR
ncbi:hypothetical protein ACLQ2T_25145 [Micromonospora sp. DT229]